MEDTEDFHHENDGMFSITKNATSPFVYKQLIKTHQEGIFQECNHAAKVHVEDCILWSQIQVSHQFNQFQ